MLNTLDDRPAGKLGKPTTCPKPIWVKSFEILYSKISTEWLQF